MRKILSSITKITSNPGAIIEQYTYTAYGKPYRWNQLQNKYTPVNGAASSIGNTRMYTGREYDREILLTYHRARYYDANLGRFTSRDPIGIKDDINLYTYTANNPVNYVDRMGTEKKFIAEHDATELLLKDMENGRKENLLSLLKETGQTGYDKGKYNTKYRTDYREISFDSLTRENCSNRSNFGNCKVYVNQDVEASLSEIGNFLIGYNFNHAGFTLNNNNSGDFTNDIYEAGLFTELLIRQKQNFGRPLRIEQKVDAVLDEQQDQFFYTAGYNFVLNEEVFGGIFEISDYLLTK